MIIVPQLLFSGLIPLNTLPNWAQAFAAIMPLKYAGDAQSSIILYGQSITTEGWNISVLFLFLIVLTIINVLGLKRYRKA
jgi:ABC-2 type transporter.